MRKLISSFLLLMAFAAAADNSCQVGSQFVMGRADKTFFYNAPSKRNSLIKFGRYNPEVVSQDNFEAAGIFFAKSPESSLVAVVASHHGFTMSKTLGHKFPAGEPTLFLDIDDDLVTLSDVSHHESQDPSTLLVQNHVLYSNTPDVDPERNKPGNFVCSVPGSVLDSVRGWPTMKHEVFEVPLIVWSHFFARGGRANFTTSIRTLRSPPLQ